MSTMPKCQLYQKIIILISAADSKSIFICSLHGQYNFGKGDRRRLYVDLRAIRTKNRLAQLYAILSGLSLPGKLLPFPDALLF